uniref:Uncharacterized protein n=1 Tax=Vitis vinifera TaxID=29760 RepID=A5BU31_VITVI|nr:hypothetical protein VITISV_033203 [Vitis vinifera]
MRKIWPSEDNCIKLRDKFASCEFGTPTCEIKAQLAKVILQLVNLELNMRKWIPSCEINLRDFHKSPCNGVFPSEVARYMLQAGSWEPQDGSQLRSPARIAFCCEVISQPFLSVCEISQTPFSLAKWFLEHPDICYRHLEIFSIRFFVV